MAEKRMVKKTLIDSDLFTDMPLSAQALYFHLLLRSDDEGFIDCPKKISRIIGCNDDDLKLLMAKRFVIGFETGVIVIRHWKLHNCIRKDRLTPTAYQEELSMLGIDRSGAYTLDLSEAIEDKEATVTSSDLDTFFDSLWALYPRKSGKGSVSLTQKKKLYNIGFEQLQRCVERYKKEIQEKHTDEKYIKMGSTFFNSGYVDYLDENYEGDYNPPDRISKTNSILKGYQ